MGGASAFSCLADDVVLIILFKLEADPRDWARLACVCRRFSFLVRNICCKFKCNDIILSVVADLFSEAAGTESAFAGGWSSLHKLAVCCPGLHHAGVLLEHSDFGLERDLGPDEVFPLPTAPSSVVTQPIRPEPECSWSLYDDLYDDTVYDVSETGPEATGTDQEREGAGSIESKRNLWQWSRQNRHLASGAWSLSREEGNKLLASRFRGDTLYICDWPGCVHEEEKRNYMLFRGFFKNFKSSRVWRTISDGNKNKIDLDCAFCSCKQTWDLHSAFCLRRLFGFHDDGEPVVRAYVCENGHVSGAWTDRPRYT